MAAVVVGTPTTATNLGAVTVAVPSGSLAGDILAVWVSTTPSQFGSALTYDASLTPLAGTGEPVYVYTRTLSAPVTGTLSFGNRPDFVGMTAVAVLIRGADSVGTPVVLPDNGSTYTSHPGLTTNGRNSLALWWEWPTFDARASGATRYVPAGFTEAPSAARLTLGVAHRSYADQGSTGNVAVVQEIQQASLIGMVEVRSKNLAPFSPTLLTPTVGETLNKDNANRFTWQHSDPDGDGQRAYALRARLTGTTTWTIGVSAELPVAYRDFPAGYFPNGDYEWQVATSDTSGLTGPWSGSSFFTVATAPVAPTITAPINGSTIGVPQVALTWTSSGPGVTSFQVRKVADSFGTATTTVLDDSDSGEQPIGDRRWLFTLPVNNRAEHLQVREKAAGLWSPWASVRVNVSYTTPAIPSLALAAVKTVPVPGAFTDAIRATLSTPPRAAGQPRTDYFNLYRRIKHVDDFGIVTYSDEKRIARNLPAGAYDDHRVASGVEYQYANQGVGDNGTTSMSDWTGTTTTAPPVNNTAGAYGAGAYGEGAYG